jgi:hypothetical protein
LRANLNEKDLEVCVLSQANSLCPQKFNYYNISLECRASIFGQIPMQVIFQQCGNRCANHIQTGWQPISDLPTDHEAAVQLQIQSQPEDTTSAGFFVRKIFSKYYEM